MRWLLAGLMAILLGWTAPARASGDYGCSQSWKLNGNLFSGCDSRLLLSPSNDTRVNLLLLLRDRHHLPVQPPTRPNDAPLLPLFEWMAFHDAWQPPAPPSDDYLNGEGSRCRSNDTGKADFAAAVRAARGLTEPERTALIAARNAFNPNCGDTPGVLAPITDTLAKPWADYLRAAAAFYDGRYDAAAPAFAALTDASDRWLAETARYMVARVELNRADADAYTDYGDLDFAKVDKAALARTATAFDRYLSAYPAGRYAGSARGLMRRVWWLGGDRQHLAAAYAALLAQPAATRGIDDFELAQEIDNKLPADKSGDVTDPLLLAVHDLAAMRDAQPTLTVAALDAQRPAFAREPALYGYLKAAFAFYVAHDPTEVLRLIPDATRERDSGTVALSRQLLRGQALDATRDANARGFWLQLLPAAAMPMQRSVVELGLALHEERAGHLDALLAPGSALTSPPLRETLLFSTADAAILRRAARSTALPRRERELALFQLLYKELSRGYFTAFVQDLALVPAGATQEGAYDQAGATSPLPLGLFTRTSKLGELGCPAIRATAATLAARPTDARARLCVGDFMLSSGFDGGVWDAHPSVDELGGTRSLFPGKPYERAAVYRDLLASAATPSDDKAYALYRAVRCYAPGGYNSCGGPDMPKAQRRAWFLRLKHDHPRSTWAQRSDLYW